MKLNKIFFSPTNTTKKILDGITKGISVTSVKNYNLSSEEIQSISINSGLSLIGIPVYNGNLHEEAVKQLNKFNAEKQLCVVVITYGDEHYENLLDELKELVKDRGFIPVAAAAFLGKAKFTDINDPVPVDVPDKADIDACLKFGHKINEKLLSVEKIIDDVLNTTEMENS
ncbi:MAG: flavodoxin family protein [Rhodothermaceae bacterium]